MYMFGWNILVINFIMGVLFGYFLLNVIVNLNVLFFYGVFSGSKIIACYVMMFDLFGVLLILVGGLVCKCLKLCIRCFFVGVFIVFVEFN